MDVNFTGIKNISYKFYKTNDGRKERWLSVQLNNNDLVDFENAIKKSKYKCGEYNHPFKEDFVNIFSSSRKDNDFIMLNNELLESKDRNLPIFDFIANLTRKIKAGEDCNYDVDYSYKKDDLSKVNLIFNDWIDEKSVYNKENIVKGAKNINIVIQRIMEKYFR